MAGKERKEEREKRSEERMGEAANKWRGRGGGEEDRTE